MGYTREEQPAEGAPKVRIGGITLSSNPDEFNEGNALTAPAEGSQNDGGNPNIPSGVAFANGQDNRNYPSNGGANPYPAMPGC